MSPQCKKAIKILTQYERLSQRRGIQLSPARIALLDKLRDMGVIKSTDLPGKLTREFPGEFAGLTLAEVRRACAQ